MEPSSDNIIVTDQNTSSVLEKVTQTTFQLLTNFANNPEFQNDLTLAFGETNQTKVDSL